MLKRALFAFAATLAVLPLFADLTLKNAELADATIVIRHDNAPFQGSFLDKKFTEFQEQQIAANPDLKDMKALEAMLPPGSKEKMKVMVVSNENLENRPENLQGNILIVVEYPASVKPLFDAFPALAALKPEVAEKVTITPTKVGEYAALELSSKKNNAKFLVVSSNSGTVFLMGTPELVKQAVTAPQTFGPVAAKAVNAVADAPGAFVVVLPQSLKTAIKDGLHDDESLPPEAKAALAGINSVALTWTSSPADITLAIQGIFQNDTEAAALKAGLLDTMVVPAGKQMLPSLLGPGFEFPQTIASLQKGALAGLSIKLTEKDCNAFKPMFDDAAAKLLKAQGLNVPGETVETQDAE